MADHPVTPDPLLSSAPEEIPTPDVRQVIPSPEPDASAPEGTLEADRTGPLDKGGQEDSRSTQPRELQADPSSVQAQKNRSAGGDTLSRETNQADSGQTAQTAENHPALELTPEFLEADRKRRLDSLNALLATMPPRPDRPEQWYRRRPDLYAEEVQYVRERFPRARVGFFQSNGNMYWSVELNIRVSGLDLPAGWTFLLLCEDNGYPRPNIHAIPIRPSGKDLEKLARDAGRPGVPWLAPLLSDLFCLENTRGQSGFRHADQALATAADWATHFLVGLQDDRIWNRWCDCPSYRHLMIP